MKPTTALGIISETLLVAGIILVIFDVYTNQVFIGCGFGVTTCGNFFQLIWPLFYLALGFLVASAIGFLFLLNQSGKPSSPSS